MTGSTTPKPDRILIVDDARTNINILVQALKDEYKLGITTNGHMALDYARHNPIDLILLDIMMPDMDGYEVCARLKNGILTSDVPVIFVTAMDDMANKARGFALGAVDYITKPFDVVEVKARVKAHLSLKHARHALQEANSMLEARVAERTTELREANMRLERDIAERKRAEEQLQKSKAMLQMVFDGISEPLVMLDENMDVRMINRAAKDYYTLVDYSGVTGKPCFAAFMGRSHPCAKCRKPLSDLRGFTGSFERQGPLNPRKLERVAVYHVADEPTGEDAYVVRISDITQSRLMERQLIQSEKLASLGLLMSGIAHEINNPNSFISFNIPILRSYIDTLMPIIDDHARGHADFKPLDMDYEELREDIFKLVDNMEHGSSRINATVSGLKEFVRKREKVELSEVDVGQVVEKAVMLCRSEIKKSVKSLQVNVPTGIAPFHSDPEALEQVLVNLLINAAHAADKEDSWVRLEVLADDGQVQYCAIEVSDNGRGMDEATKHKIFDPFFTTKAALKGTGLGLFICHNLVEGLGGRIEVESEPGNGSIFRVVLHNGASRNV